MQAMLTRRVESETLDGLSADDPRAQHARSDLRRVHRAMRSATVLAAAISQALSPSERPQRWLEVGAGDATLLARLAPRLARRWPHVELTLLDRQPCVAEWSRRRLHEAGWQVREVAADVFDALSAARRTDGCGWNLVLANLFVHHFDGAALDRLLDLIAARALAFVACEPRRSAVALLGSHLVGLLGANQVTREDAVLSVHAGFTNGELTALWPTTGWRVLEYPALPFTHCFVAKRGHGAAHAL
jgi:SAM-dependent methyltransferase